MTTDVRPFALHVPDAALEDLRERLGRTRWPEAETVVRPGGPPDWSQGPPLALVRGLAAYWADTYDWRRVEAELNAHGQALTEVDGLDLHLLHVRSPRPDARPLVLTHGWPSSVLEPLAVMDALADPGGRGAARLPRRRPVPAGVRLRRPAGVDRLGRRPDGGRLGGGAGAARVRPLLRRGRRLGRTRHGGAGRPPPRPRRRAHSFTPVRRGAGDARLTSRPRSSGGSGGRTSSGGRAGATPSSSRRGRRPSPTSSPTPRSPS